MWRGEEEVTEETGDIGEAEVTEEEEEVTTGLLEKMPKDSLLSRTSKTTTQEAEAEEETEGTIEGTTEASTGEAEEIEVIEEKEEGVTEEIGEAREGTDPTLKAETNLRQSNQLLQETLLLSEHLDCADY